MAKSQRMNKDIREYSESMFFGLSLRQFFFVAIGCAISVGMPWLMSLGLCLLMSTENIF